MRQQQTNEFLVEGIPKPERDEVPVSKEHENVSQYIDSLRKSGGKKAPLYRYNLNIPRDLYDEVQRVAEERQTTVIDMFRRFIKLGLLAVYLEEQPDAALIIREGDVEREVLLL